MAEVRILYLATADGLVQLANPGKSDRWREIGRAHTGHDVRAVAASPTDALLAVAGGPDGIELTVSGGAGWEHASDEPIGALLFDDAGRALAGAASGAVLASPDGRNWSLAATGPSAIVQLLSGAGGMLLAVAGDGSLAQIEGAVWRSYEPAVADVRAVAAGHADPSELFIVTLASLLGPGGSSALASPPTGALMVLGGMPPALLLGTHGELLRSDDRGATLEPIDGPRGVTALVSPQRAVDQVFAGTSAGELWYSADRGRAWQQLASGYAPIRSLAFARAL